MRIADRPPAVKILKLEQRFELLGRDILVADERDRLRLSRWAELMPIVHRLGLAGTCVRPRLGLVGLGCRSCHCQSHSHNLAANGIS